MNLSGNAKWNCADRQGLYTGLSVRGALGSSIIPRPTRPVTARRPLTLLVTSVCACAKLGWLAINCIRSRVSDVMRSSGRLEALLMIIVLGLCATQLTACITAYPRDGVPTEQMATAEVSGYPSDIRVWGDSDASFPADPLVSFRDERIKAAKTDPSIKLRELDALTLSGGGSSGAFGAGILAGWAKAGTRPKFELSPVSVLDL